MSQVFSTGPLRASRLPRQLTKAGVLLACLLLRACSGVVPLGGTSESAEGGEGDASVGAAGGASGSGGDAGTGAAGVAGSSDSGLDAGGESGFDDAPDADENACPKYESGVSRGQVSAVGLLEASGLAASRKNARLLWAHNDSGDLPRVFALRDDGAELGIYSIDGAAAQDWEDMALGPGPITGQDYLYMGDIGDNSLARPTVSVYRVAEPTVDALAAPQNGNLSGVARLEFRYPDGRHNAEALLVDPISGDLFIVSKEVLGQSGVYRAESPLVTTQTTELERVATLKFGEAPLVGSTLATAGDIAPSGTAILIRTYTNAFLWRRPLGTSVAVALSGTPCVVPVVNELQGEAIGFAADENGYYSIGEANSPPLYFFARQR